MGFSARILRRELTAARDTKQVDRIEITQAALNATGRGNYLEIGVCTGASFIPLRAARKWGVDPDHYLSWKRINKYRLFSLLHIRHEAVFRETSDQFFERHERLLRTHGLDVGFVDGLHTYRQALRDILNCLEYLNANGLVLVHDCNPENELAATPAADISELMAMNIEGWNGVWSGDVWKAIVHLRSLRGDLTVFVLDCDNGVGVVTRGPALETLPYSEREIEEMDYGFLASNRQKLLGLESAHYIYEFLRSRSR